MTDSSSVELQFVTCYDVGTNTQPEGFKVPYSAGLTVSTQTSPFTWLDSIVSRVSDGECVRNLSSQDVVTLSHVNLHDCGATGNVLQDASVTDFWPGFTRPDLDDIHLFPTSPLVDAGHVDSPYDLEPSPNGYALLDEGSATGVFVNGRRVDRHELGDGEVITIGDTSLTFVRSPQSQPTFVPTSGTRVEAGGTEPQGSGVPSSGGTVPEETTKPQGSGPPPTSLAAPPRKDEGEITKRQGSGPPSGCWRPPRESTSRRRE